jgi:hypothetical protein
MHKTSGLEHLTNVHFQGQRLISLVQGKRNFMLCSDTFGQSGISVGELLRKVREVSLSLGYEVI